MNSEKTLLALIELLKAGAERRAHQLEREAVELEEKARANRQEVLRLTNHVIPALERNLCPPSKK